MRFSARGQGLWRLPSGLRIQTLWCRPLLALQCGDLSCAVHSTAVRRFRRSDHCVSISTTWANTAARFTSSSAAPLRAQFCAVLPHSTPPTRCLLCDAQWDTQFAESPSSPTAESATQCGETMALAARQRRWWAAHCCSPMHTAREAICSQFVAPDRSDFILKHLENHLRVDVRTLDEVDAKRVMRRRQRLFSSLDHLRRTRTVHQYAPVWHGHQASRAAASDAVSEEVPPPPVPLVTEAFLNHTLVGASHARVAVMDRVARLMPHTSATELSSITAYILSTRQLSRLYDDLQFSKLVPCADEAAPTGPPSTPCTMDAPLSTTVGERARPCVTAREKAVVVFSCLGELLAFSRQDRPRGVAGKVAADALVLHVLASHALDGIVADLVHGTLQRVVDEGLPVFRQYTEEMKRLHPLSAQTPEH